MKHLHYQKFLQIVNWKICQYMFFFIIDGTYKISVFVFPDQELFMVYEIDIAWRLQMFLSFYQLPCRICILLFAVRVGPLANVETNKISPSCPVDLYVSPRLMHPLKHEGWPATLSSMHIQPLLTLSSCQ